MNKNNWGWFTVLRDYPVIFGEGLQKGICIHRNERMGGIDLDVVWLKHKIPSGSSFGEDEIDGVDAVLHFSNPKQVERLTYSLACLLEVWKEEEEFKAEADRRGYRLVKKEEKKIRKGKKEK